MYILIHTYYLLIMHIYDYIYSNTYIYIYIYEYLHVYLLWNLTVPIEQYNLNKQTLVKYVHVFVFVLAKIFT